MKLPKSFTTVTPLSKTLALFLFIFLPFVGFYLGLKFSQATDNLSLAPSPTIINSSFSPVLNVNTTNWQTYRNSKWNFELKLPPTWKGYSIFEHSYQGNSSPHDYTADVVFYFNRPKGVSAAMINFAIFSTEEWNKVIKKGGQLPNLLGESNGFFYTANGNSPAQCGSNNEPLGQLDEFQCARSKEVPEILSTFQFSK